MLCDGWHISEAFLGQLAYNLHPGPFREKGPAMQLWIDADACPRVIKDIAFRIVRRLDLPLCLVSNSPLPLPDSPLISNVVVEKGPDVADDYIAARVNGDDIVVTADIPLASEVVRRGALAIDPRGTLYSESNVAERLAVRNLMAEIRGTTLNEIGGPPPFTAQDRKRFADTLDRLLTRRLTRGDAPGK